MCYCSPGYDKQHCVACRNKYIPNHIFGALLGILWDSWSEAKTCSALVVWFEGLCLPSQ